MIPISPATRVYLAAGATDIRRGFDGLADLARHVLEVDPYAGHLCLFCNRRRNRLKVLYADNTGLWICSKRLEKGCYSWPQPEEGVRKIRLSAEELALLLGGLEINEIRRKPWWRNQAA